MYRQTRYLQVDISIVLVWSKQVRVAIVEGTGSGGSVVGVPRVATGDVDGDLGLI